MPDDMTLQAMVMDDGWHGRRTSMPHMSAWQHKTASCP